MSTQDFFARVFFAPDDAVSGSDETPETKDAPKKRGRPPKPKSDAKTPAKKRGRPKKEESRVLSEAEKTESEKAPQKSHGTQKETAENAARHLSFAQLAARQNKGGAPTLHSCLDLFASHLRDARGSSFHTVRSYTRDIIQFIEWLEEGGSITGKSEPGKVTYHMVRRYLTHLTSSYERRSVLRKLAAIRTFFRFIERQEIISVNPATPIVAPRSRLLLPSVLNVEEVEQLLLMPDPETPFGLRDRALLEVLYATGLRVSEAAALSLNDIDWRAGEVRVNRGKGDRDRIVLLGSHAIDALRIYVDSARPLLLARRRNQLGPVIEAVWINARGTRLSAHAIYMQVIEYSVQLGIDKNVTPHTLRHSFATHLLQGGADLRVVQELLGHKSLTSTQIYTRISAAHLKQAYDAAHPRASLENAGRRSVEVGLDPTIFDDEAAQLFDD